MNKRPPIPRDHARIMAERARQHFKSIAALSELDRAEQKVTPEQFARAAKIAVRIIANARNRWRRK